MSILGGDGVSPWQIQFSRYIHDPRLLAWAINEVASMGFFRITQRPGEANGYTMVVEEIVD